VWGETLTIAVCIKCGKTKFGAFSNCERCGQSPASAKELAVSLLLSDHYYPIKELKEIGIEIAKTGCLPVFSERRQTEIMSTMKYTPYLDMLLKPSPPKCREPEVNNHREMRFTDFYRISKTISKLFRKKGKYLEQSKERPNITDVQEHQ
jgi:hypothetical protein